MVQKYFFWMLFPATLWISSCDSNLQIQTEGIVANDCTQNPSSEGCLGLHLHILSDSYVTNNPSVEIKWVAPENVLSYTLNIAENPDCSNVKYTYDQFEDYKSIDLLNDGHYYVCVTATLKDGTKEAADNNGVRITVDRDKPELKNTQDSLPQAGSETAIAIEATDLTKLSFQWSQTSGNGEVLFSDPKDPNALIKATAEGHYELKLTATDEAGNSEEILVPFIWDVTPPSLDAGADLNVSTSPVSLSASTTDPSAKNFKWSMISGPSGAVASFSNSGSLSTDAVLNVFGTYVFKITAEDGAGNVGEDTVTVNLQGVILTFTSIDLINHALDSYISLADTLDTDRNIAANLVASGHTTASYGLSAASGTCSSAVFGVSIPRTSDVAGLSDGSYKVCVKLEAPSATTIYGESSVFTKDIVAPAAPTGLNWSGVSSPANTTSLTPAWTLSVDGDVASQSIQYYADGTCGTNYGGAVAKSSGNNSDSFNPVEGLYSFRVTATDQAGNSTTTACSSSMTVDVTAPTGTITLSGNAAYYTTGTSPSIGLTGSGSPTEYQLCSNAATAGNACTGVVRAWAAYTASPAAYDFTSDGTKTLYVQFRDAAGNISATSSDSIEIDNASPSGTIVLNGGVNTYNNAGDTSPSIALTESGNAVEYQLCLSSAVQGSNCGSIARAWATYTASPTAHDFGSGGLKTLYVQFKDAAGNISQTYSDDVTIVTNVASMTLAAGATYYTTGTNPAISVQDDGTATEFQLCSDSATATNNCATPVVAWAAYPASVPATYDFGSDGTHTLYVQFKNAGGDISATVSDSIIIDNAAPSGTITLTGGATYHTGDQAPTIALTESGGASQYQLCLNTATAGNNCSSVARSWASYTATPTAFDFASDGLKTLYLQFRDAAGNISATVSDDITIDTATPTGSITLSGGVAYHTADQSPSIALTESGGAAEYQLCTDTATIGNDCTTPVRAWAAYTATPADYDFASDGLKTLYVQFRDAAGNTSATVSDDVTIDTSAPTGSVTLSGGAAYHIADQSPSIALTESGSAAEYQLCLNTATAGNNCSSVARSWAAYTATPADYDFASDGLKTLYVQFRDAVGNISATVSDDITIDTAIPTGSITLSGGATYHTADQSPSIALTESGGAAEYQLCLNTATAGNNCSSVARSWASYTATPADYDFASDGLKTLYVQFRDAAGNISATVSDDITIDTATPTGSITLSGGATYHTADQSPSIALTESGGAAEYQLCTDTATIGNDCATPVRAWAAYTATPADYDFASEGAKTLYVQFRDAAGNTSQTYGDSIIIDTAVPTSTSISIEGGAGYINTTSVTMTLGASDAIGIEMYLTNTAGCASGGTYETFNSSKAWTLVQTESTATVYVKFRDLAGNESACISDTIVHDNTVPSSPSISIDGGATIASDTVNLTLSATDTNLYQMYITNTAGCASGGSWEAYNTSKSSWAHGADDTTATVYVKYSDYAGNESSCVSDSVVHYDRPENATSFEPLPGFTREGVSMTWAAGARAVGYVLYRQDTGTGDITWSPTDGTTYTTSSNITGDPGADSSSKIVYVGTDLSAVDKESLADNATYMYKLFAYNSDVPVEYDTGVQRLSRTYPYQTIDVGNFNTCATKFGRLRCWGGNISGQLGLGHTNSIGDDEYPYEVGDVPVGVDVLSARVAVSNVNAAGHTCALTVEGRVRCWGSAWRGKTGYNNTTDTSSPGSDVPLEQSSGVPATIIMMDTGHNHTCVLTNRGKVRCFGDGLIGGTGYDSSDPLGDSGTEIEDLADVSLPGNPTISEVTAGNKSTCVVTTQNKGRCWGSNLAGELGQDINDNIGDGAVLMSTVDDIAVGDIIKISNHGLTTCAVTSTNAVRCWGECNQGRCGYGNQTDIGNGTTSISNATDIDIDSTNDNIVTDVLASGVSTCIINTSGQLKCWGENYGQAGYGDTTVVGSSNTPSARAWHDFGSKIVQVAGGSDSAAQSHICALTESGEIYCWGEAGYGALGNKSSVNIGDDEVASHIPPVPVWGPVQSTPGMIRPDNLKVWLDASDESTVYSSTDCSTTLASDGGTVGCIKDKSGQSNNATQTTSSNQPTWVKSYSHGEHTLSFDGAGDHIGGIVSGYTGGDSPYTLFIVFKSHSAIIDNIRKKVFVLGDTLSANQAILFQYNTLTETRRGHVQNHITYPASTTGQSDQTIMSGSYTGGGVNTTTISHYENSVELTGTGGGSNTGASLSIPSTPDFDLAGGAGDFKGSISEVIFYDTALSDSEREAVESYLRSKWQKGVDGLATTKLSAHYDAMKSDTTTTDTCSTATVVATNGGLVQCWKDRSGNGNHVEQTTSGSRPSLVTSNTDLGGERSVHFQSSLLTRSASKGLSSGDEPWSIATVMDLEAAVGNEGAIAFGAFGDSQEFGFHFATTSLLAGGHNNALGYDNTQVNTLLNGQGSFVLSVDYQGGAAILQTHVDGQSKTHALSHTWSAFSTPSNPAILLGGRVDGGSRLDDDQLSEVLTYNRTLSVSEQYENDTYLMKKWRKTNDHTKAPGGIAHGLSLWLDGYDTSSMFQDVCSTSATPVSTNGDSVRCWKDKSGMENHVEAASGEEATYSTAQINGRAALYFDGSDGYQGTLPEFTVTDQENTIFVVTKLQDLSDKTVYGIGNAKSSNQKLHLHQNNSTTIRASTFHDHINVTILNPQNVAKMYTMGYEGGTLSLWDAGKLIGSDAKTLNLATSPNVYVGQIAANDQNIQGYIAELVVYNRKLSNAERQSVEAYLAQKWLEDKYTDCTHAEDSGQTVDGTLILDRDGYNGPLAPYSASCDFSPYSNLVAWWRLDEASGSTATDSAGSNNGTHTNISAANIGVISALDKGVTFDGTDDYIVATGYKGITGAADRTTTAWIKTTATDGGILAYGEQTSSQKWMVRVVNNQLYLGVQGNGITGTTNIADGQWHHVAVSFTNDGSPDVLDAKLYVDGVEEVLSSSGSQTINTSATNDVVIGTNLNSVYFNGTIDDVRLYNKGLSASEVLELYKQGQQ